MAGRVEGENRYGFNGKENDTDLTGNNDLSTLDFGGRIYNPSIGRWLSVDPLAHKLPGLSPFNYANANPIYNVDPEGQIFLPFFIPLAVKLTDRGVAMKVASRSDNSEAVLFTFGLANGFVSALDVDGLAQEHKAVLKEWIASKPWELNTFNQKSQEQLVNTTLGIEGISLMRQAEGMIDMFTRAYEGDSYSQGQVTAMAVSMLMGGKRLPAVRRSLGRKVLMDVTKKYAADVIEAFGQKERGPVISGVLDTKTGEVFVAINKQQKTPVSLSNLHPILRKRLEKLLDRTNNQGNRPEYTGEIPGSHAEINALNQALKAREKKLGRKVTEAELNEFLLHNRYLKGSKKGKGTPPRCADCAELTEGVKTVGTDEK